MSNKPMLNLGCGTIILPGPQPDHHRLIPAGIYNYPFWVNVDRNQAEGVDKIVDLFSYPWDFEDNSFSGAIVPHLAEHIPHEIKPNTDLLHPLSGAELPSEKNAYTYTPENYEIAERAKIAQCRWDEIKNMQGGWFAFFSELWRILEPGSLVYVLSPYGWTAGAMGDPTHTRPIVEHTFYHSIAPDQNATFQYVRKMHYEYVGYQFTISQWFGHLMPEPTSGAEWDKLSRKQQLEIELRNEQKNAELQHALITQLNVVTDICATLRVVKDGN